jgi:YidC/Oxa1 family membrane protein insertase
MSQQFYVIRNNPAPGTPAAAAKAKRDAEKHRQRGSDTALGGVTSSAPALTTEPPPTPRRTQPKKQSREQRKKNRPPAGGAHPASPDGPDEP